MGAAMGGAPKPPKPLAAPPPPPTPVNPGVTSAKNRQRAAGSNVRSSTLLTSPMGITGTSGTGQKTLLGA